MSEKPDMSVSIPALSQQISNTPDVTPLLRKSSTLVTERLQAYKVTDLDLIPPPPTEDDQDAILTLPDGRVAKVPIIRGTLGGPMLDIRTLYQQIQHFTFDPGFTTTASTSSSITFVDGENGRLLHRGYQIQDLVRQCCHLELCYLLLYGELPDREEFSKFQNLVMDEMMVHQQFIQFFKGFGESSHPMAIMTGVVGALSAFMQAEAEDIREPIWRELTAIRVIAKIPTLAAFAYRTSTGLPIVYPKRSLSFTDNFLYMLFKDTMSDEFHIHPSISKAMNAIFMLHADHGQNASTSTVRIAGSSLANPYACMAAGIASLWGPAHGGANEAALEMLQEIGTVENVPLYLSKAKDKNDPFRLMGFGHRIYKSMDPRCVIMREMCHEVLEATGKKHEGIFKLALELEQIALSDPYFIQRKLYPNVDFYSGIVLDAIGIPKSMFTVIFAVSRAIGWISQWREMVSMPDFKISRPRQLYVGKTNKTVKEIARRPVRSETNVPQVARNVWTSL